MLAVLAPCLSAIPSKEAGIYCLSFCLLLTFFLFLNFLTITPARTTSSPLCFRWWMLMLWYWQRCRQAPSGCSKVLLEENCKQRYEYETGQLWPVQPSVTNPYGAENDEIRVMDRQIIKLKKKKIKTQNAYFICVMYIRCVIKWLQKGHSHKSNQK